MHLLTATPEETGDAGPRPFVAAGERNDPLFKPRQLLAAELAKGNEGGSRVVAEDVVDHDVQAAADVHGGDGTPRVSQASVAGISGSGSVSVRRQRQRQRQLRVSGVLSRVRRWFGSRLDAVG